MVFKKGKIQKIVNFNDNLRIYNVIVVNGVDISELLSNRYEVFVVAKITKNQLLELNCLERILPRFLNC